jgi:hypothetical protein
MADEPPPEAESSVGVEAAGDSLGADVVDDSDASSPPPQAAASGTSEMRAARARVRGVLTARP